MYIPPRSSLLQAPLPGLTAGILIRTAAADKDISKMVCGGTIIADEIG